MCTKNVCPNYSKIKLSTIRKRLRPVQLKEKQSYNIFLRKTSTIVQWEGLSNKKVDIYVCICGHVFYTFFKFIQLRMNNCIISRYKCQLSLLIKVACFSINFTLLRYISIECASQVPLIQVTKPYATYDQIGIHI